MDFIYDPGLVLYVPLYKLDGASFKSRDAYGHPCTVTGASWRPGGTWFDGADDVITTPNHASLQISGHLTLEAWVNVADLDAARMILVKEYIKEYEFFANNDGIGLYYGNGTNYNYYVGTTAIAVTTWTHVVVTRGAVVTFYINGQLDVARSLGAYTPTTGTNPVYVGGRSGGASPFKGIIGEVRIYNRALSPLEIQHNYLATKWRYR